MHIASNYPVERILVKGETWLEPEEAAYPNGGMTRKARVRFSDGKLRMIRAGIPDTYFSVPATARVNGRYVAGFITIDSKDELRFHANVTQSVPAGLR